MRIREKVMGGRVEETQRNQGKRDGKVVDDRDIQVPAVWTQILPSFHNNTMSDTMILRVHV
jgi:phage gp37-like protein